MQSLTCLSLVPFLRLKLSSGLQCPPGCLHSAPLRSQNPVEAGRGVRLQPPSAAPPFLLPTPPPDPTGPGLSQSKLPRVPPAGLTQRTQASCASAQSSFHVGLRPKLPVQPPGAGAGGRVRGPVS